MDKVEFHELIIAALKGSIPDEENPALIFSGLSTAMLKKIASGEVDAQAIAEHILETRK